MPNIGPHGFSMPCIPCRHGDPMGQFAPYRFASTEASLTCRRKVRGWPARLGETIIEIRSDSPTGTPRSLRRPATHPPGARQTVERT